MRERAFQAAVIELAELQGWRVYHTHDSRRSRPGFPDLTMVRHGELVFAELKTDSPQSRPTAAQNLWLSDLGHVADLVEENISARPSLVRVFLWRPSDWPEIERALRR